MIEVGIQRQPCKGCVVRIRHGLQKFNVGCVVNPRDVNGKSAECLVRRIKDCNHNGPAPRVPQEWPYENPVLPPWSPPSTPVLQTAQAAPPAPPQPVTPVQLPLRAVSASLHTSAILHRPSPSPSTSSNLSRSFAMPYPVEFSDRTLTII